MINKVLITGATGKTGSLVVKKLKQLPNEFQVVGLARSLAKVKQIFGSTQGFIEGDILNKTALKLALQGCQYLVILTSAMPKMKSMPQSGQKPEFEFETNGMPEQVDWLGQKNQIDAAKESGVKHIVLVGSMGGTNPHHPLNMLGNGNILLWKRKAEEYLIDSKVDYTIIRAGGLIDQPDSRRELIVGKNDTLLSSPPNGIPTSIPRGDVANVVIQALKQPLARNKAFDVISKPEDDAEAMVTSDWQAFFAQTTEGL